MKRFEVKVNNETVDYLERLNFEVEGMRRVIKEIITDNIYNSTVLDGETFKTYNSRYEERVAAYELAKQELTANYIPAEILNSDCLSQWNLDFNTGILSFETSGTKFDNFELVNK